MAGLPQYEQQVAPRPVPTPYGESGATPDAFGAAVGEQAQQGAAAIDEIAKHEKAKADSAAVVGALGQANDALNKGILDQQSGYLSLKGGNALAGSEPALQEFGKKLKAIQGGLVNDDQREMFQRHAVQLADEAFRHVQSHLGQQRDQLYHEQFLGQANALDQKLQQEAVALSPADSLSALQQLRGAALTRAAQMGLSGQDAENYAIPFLQKGALGVIDKLKAMDTPDALATARAFVKNPDTQNVLGGRLTSIVEAQIERRSDEQNGIIAAHQIANANRRAGTSIVDGTAYDQLAKQVGRPGMLKAAEIELDRIVTEGRKAQESSNRRAFTQGMAAIGAADRPFNSKAFNAAVDALSMPDGDGGEYLGRLYNAQATAVKRSANAPEVRAAQSLATLRAADKISRTDVSGMTFEDFSAQPVVDGSPSVIESVSQSQLAGLQKAFQARQAQIQGAADHQLPSDIRRLMRDRLSEALSVPTSGDLDEDHAAILTHVEQHVVDQRAAWLASKPKGAQPGPKEYSEWIGEQLAKVPGSGYFGTNVSARLRVEQELQQPHTDAATLLPLPNVRTTAQAIRGYRWSADRKQRAPVYSDGSIGPIEDAP